MSFTFIPGYGGAVKATVSSTVYDLPMGAWDFGFEVELLPYDTFFKTLSINWYFKFFLAGLATGDVRMRGFWDNTGGQNLSGPTILIQPGQQPAIFLGYTASVGYTLSGIIQSINPKQEAAGTSDFDFNYKVMGITALTGQT